LTRISKEHAQTRPLFGDVIVDWDWVECHGFHQGRQTLISDPDIRS
jgi:hypothetical protein